MEEIKKQLEEIKEEQTAHGKILASVDKTLALQAQQLEYHIKRTDIAEENITMLRDAVKPLLDRKVFMDILVRIAAISATVAATGYYGLQIVKFIIGL